MAGYISQRVAEAKARRDEASSRMEVIQGPPKQIERPSMVARTGDPPPLPPHIPAVTPVANTKNRTAMASQYSPDAAKLLFDTPMKIHYVPGGGGGYSSERPYQIEVLGGDSQVPAGEPGSYEDVVEHEFAHKWHETRLSPELKNEWKRAAVPIANAVGYPRDPVGHWLPNENEIYAGFAQSGPMGETTGPFGMSPMVRDRFYDGLYRDDLKVQPALTGPSVAKQWSPPGGYDASQWIPEQAYADYVRSERGWDGRSINRRYLMPPSYNSDAFSTEYWVNDRNAPMGYYEDGSKPSQWIPPRWPPSLSIYELNTPDENGFRG